MKTIIFKLLIACFLLPTFSFSCEILSDTDSTNLKNVEERVLIFKMNCQNNLLTVNIDGPIQDLATLSITNQNGTELMFQFIQKENKTVEIDIEKLTAGDYFLILNNGQEIRILRFSKLK
jgi:hypothetical protein